MHTVRTVSAICLATTVATGLLLTSPVASLAQTPPASNIPSQLEPTPRAAWKTRDVAKNATAHEAGNGIYPREGAWRTYWNSWVNSERPWAGLNLKTKRLKCKRISVTATASSSWHTLKNGTAPVYPIQLMRGGKKLAEAGATQDAMPVTFSASGKSVLRKNLKVIVHRATGAKPGSTADTAGDVYISVRGLCSKG